MDSKEIKGALLFIGLILLGGLLFLGLFLFALIFVALAAIIFTGFYTYIRIKLWQAKRHPPKILEGPEDYL
jgi:hypothetical protein